MRTKQSSNRHFIFTLSMTIFLSGILCAFDVSTNTSHLVKTSKNSLNRTSAWQNEASKIQCYSIPSSDSPVALLKEDSINSEEQWCYQKLAVDNNDSTLIFKIEENHKISPELSLLKLKNGNIIHSSIEHGVRSIHRLQSTYNPFQVPLDPPDSARPVSRPLTDEAVADTENIYHILSSAESTIEDLSVKVGDYSGEVPENLIPWRGYWFPNTSGRLHDGPNSPMAKFDRMTLARTGLSAGAFQWETVNHGLTDLNWSGHCNGWAAASVMFPEPKVPWTDPFSGVTFTVSDLKGIYSEFSYCPKYVFFGTRNNGRGQNPRDILPQDFHNTIVYYIGHLKKPVLMDYMPSPPIENRVISRYQMKIEALTKYTFRVDMTLTIHTYDDGKSEDTGIAKNFTRTYSYTLWTDKYGNAVDGKWLTPNPDFLWVPLTYGKCSDSNPAITWQWVQSIYRPIELPW